MKQQVYEIDENGFFIGDYIVGISGELPSHYVESSPTESFYRPKWIGNAWIEGATREEIDEITKVEPLPPTEIDLLKQRLEGMEAALVDLILGGI